MQEELKAAIDTADNDERPFLTRPSFKINQHYFAEKAIKALSLGKIDGRLCRYALNTGCWCEITEDQLIKPIYDLISTERKNRPEYDEEIQAVLQYSQCKAIAKFLVSMLDIPEVERSRDFVHASNTMLVFSSSGKWEPVPFSPSFHSRNALPVSYDAQAVCHRFIYELLASAMSPSDIDLLQQYMGQCLLGTNLSQTILMLTGTAGGGKSTLANIIEMLVGLDNSVELRTENLNGRFEIGRALGKTLLAAKDVNGDFLSTKGAQRLKALTGNDRLTAEYKNKNDVLEMFGDFNVIITANTDLVPRFNGDADAWRRRLRIIRYDRQPLPLEKRIANFDRLLIEEEGSGILNFALAGAAKLLANHGRLTIQQTQQDAVEQLIAGANPYEYFVRNYVVPDPDHTITSATLLFNFKQLCDQKGWPIASDRKIQCELQEAMRKVFQASKSKTVPSSRGTSNRGYKYFRILQY
ncbi:MAG: phage/plasmid primase, P4 family [Victivallaceae bacterium]|nr:phage/plasmid primase, P4 family [Victivallaceae bacterium]